MAIHLGLPLPTASSSQPGGTSGSLLTPPYLALLLTGFTWHPPSPTDPVSSYLTLSPLPAEAGGLLSVALFPGVTPAGRYPASSPVEPGLSSLREKSGHLYYFSQTCRTKKPRSNNFFYLSTVSNVVLNSCRLLQNQYPAAMRAGNNLICAVEAVVELRRKVHVASQAVAVTGNGDGLATALSTQTVITLQQVGRQFVRNRVTAQAVDVHILLNLVDLGLFFAAALFRVLLQLRKGSFADGNFAVQFFKLRSPLQDLFFQLGNLLACRSDFTADSLIFLVGLDFFHIGFRAEDVLQFGRMVGLQFTLALFQLCCPLFQR